MWKLAFIWNESSSGLSSLHRPGFLCSGVIVGFILLGQCLSDGGGNVFGEICERGSGWDEDDIQENVCDK